MTKEELRANLLTGSTWLRIFIMVLYAIIGYVAIFVIGAVAIFQFGTVLITGKLNERLLPFGQSLSLYISQILLYITYNSDEKPFPFNNWPTATEYNKDHIVNLPNEPEPPPKND